MPWVSVLGADWQAAVKARAARMAKFRMETSTGELDWAGMDLNEAPSRVHRSA